MIFCFSYIYRFFYFDRPLDSFVFKDFLIEVIKSSNLQFLGYVGFVAIIYSYYYINRSTKMELQKAQLSEQLITAKMETLKSQLNPHFLFNTLHCISSLIKEDPYKAQNMIANLGDLLREVLLLKHLNLIPLSKEIALLKKYIDIMSVRFLDYLDVSIAIEEGLENVLIPNMLLQPIMENSFEHGYSYEFTDLEVKLMIYREEEKLVITIENNGAPIKNSYKHEGMGLKNIRERLATLYNEDYEFIFVPVHTGSGVVNTIKIPLQKDNF